MMFQGKRVWIIGASTGIGYALAKELAAQGATLFLSARDTEKLASLQNEIGLKHGIYPFDVSDIKACQRVAMQVFPLDSVIYLAAAYQPMSLLQMDEKAVNHIVSINVNGPLNFIQAIAPLVKQGKIKQIALCGSVAGYCGLPNGQPYSGTKAMMVNLAQSLRAEVPPGVDVKLISPGFVRTPLTSKNDFEMPMMIEPEQAAKAIAKGLASRGFEIHFPKRFTYLMKLLALLPYRLYFSIVSKLN